MQNLNALTATVAEQISEYHAHLKAYISRMSLQAMELNSGLEPTVSKTGRLHAPADNYKYPVEDIVLTYMAGQFLPMSGDFETRVCKARFILPTDAANAVRLLLADTCTLTVGPDIQGHPLAARYLNGYARGVSGEEVRVEGLSQMVLISCSPALQRRIESVLRPVEDEAIEPLLIMKAKKKGFISLWHARRAVEGFYTKTIRQQHGAVATVTEMARLAKVGIKHLGWKGDAAAWDNLVASLKPLPLVKSDTTDTAFLDAIERVTQRDKMSQITAAAQLLKWLGKVKDPHTARAKALAAAVELHEKRSLVERKKREAERKAESLKPAAKRADIRRKLEAKREAERYAAYLKREAERKAERLEREAEREVENKAKASEVIEKVLTDPSKLTPHLEYIFGQEPELKTLILTLDLQTRATKWGDSKGFYYCFSTAASKTKVYSPVGWYRLVLPLVHERMVAKVTECVESWKQWVKADPKHLDGLQHAERELKLLTEWS